MRRLFKNLSIHNMFGEISWVPPSWLKHFFRILRKRQVWRSILAIIILLIAGWAGYRWYQHRPKPQYPTVQINSPTQGFVPQSLIINFGMNEGDSFSPTSVAPLAQMDKPIISGVTISPNLMGKWRWQGDNQIIFRPDQPWAAGQSYTLRFDRSLLTPQTQLAQSRYEFSTSPLNLQIMDFKFYQDPIHSEIKQAIATIYFNYPIQQASLLKRIVLQEYGSRNSVQYKFSINIDSERHVAYLHSESLPLQKMPYFLQLKIDKGVEPVLGSATTTSSEQKILVPARDSIFQINNVEARIVRDQKNYPDQVLNVETSLGVTNAELKKYLHVYQLPKDLPARNNQAPVYGYSWKIPGEVDSHILQQSKVIDLRSIPTANDFSPIHSFKFKADDNSYLYVEIDKGLSGFGDFLLAEKYKQILQAPQLPREVMFSHPGSLLAFSSQKKMSVLVRGIPAVQFEIARVLPNDLNHLITQTDGKFNNPYFINNHFDQTNISKIFSEVQQFNIDDPGKVQYTTLDLDHYLDHEPSSQQSGLFLLTVKEWDNIRKTATITKAKRLVLITDMGLLVKKNSDNSTDVFVQSISQGTPVSNAEVSILGKNGVALFTHKTDNQGHVSFPNVSDFVNEREPTVYLAKNNSDISFLPYANRDRSLNYSRFDVGGLTQSDTQDSLNAYLFSDRGIYRPGDTMHLGAIVKLAYAQAAPANIPLEQTIVDPRGNTVSDQKINLPASNFFTLKYTPSEIASIGTYTINLYTVKDGQAANLLGFTNVQVQDFLPDRMKIDAEILSVSQAGWVSPSGLQAQVTLRNLFGTPAPNRRVTGKIILTPSALNFSAYPDYVFTDPLIDNKNPPKTINQTLAETHTDHNGNALFQLDLARYSNATYQLTFYTEGFESEGGRSVAAQKTVLVTPLSYLVGYKTLNDLNYLKQNSYNKVNFLAINSQLLPTSVTHVKLQLLSRQQIVTLVKKPDGTYEYQTVAQELPISQSTLDIPKPGLEYVLPTNKIGDYTLVLSDQNNTVLTKLDFSVVGNGQVSAENSTQLTVKLNKDEYRPGEDIQMQITSPYVGAGLISIERDKIYNFKWFKTTSTDSTQTITIPASFQGDGYVEVAFVRAFDSPDIFSNPLSYAVVPFSVNREAHTVHITLQAPTLVQPDAALPITYSTNQPSKIIIFAVDEGILQVADYKTPDPLSYFYRKHALEVSTQQSVDQILPNYLLSRELSAIGGDGGEVLLRNNLNPFKRKNQLPVVYWSEILNADQTPRKVYYHVPDYFNGSLRLMAVAVSDNAVGSTQQNTQVRGDFVIMPNVPTFVAPNDTFNVSVDVANNVKNIKKAVVTLVLVADPKLQIVGANTKTLSIAANGEATSSFQIRALDQLGDVPLTFIVSSGNKINKLTEDLSIRPATSFETHLQSGYSKKKIVKVTLSNFRKEYFKGCAAVSPSPLILVRGLQNYLNDFPFSCTEQVVSKAFMAMAMVDQPGFMADRNLAQTKLELAIRLLRQRQLTNGAFSYWPSAGESYATKFSTVYAMQFLTEARERGYNIPSDLFQQGLSYLKAIAGNEASNMDDARIIAYAIYILTRNEMVTTNYIGNLQSYLDSHDAKWRSEITGAYIAASYALLKNTSEAEKLIRQYSYSKTSDPYTTDFYTELSDDAQYVSIVTRYFPDLMQKLGATVLLPMTQAIVKDSYNTLAAAYSALALSSYTQTLAALPTPSQTISTINDTKQTKVLSSARTLYLQSSFDHLMRNIEFNSSAANGYFYQTTQAGFAQTINDSPVQQGLEIDSEYRDLSGKSINTVALGDEVEVHLRVRSLSNQYLNNIAIISLLPGGFEVVRDSLSQGTLDYFEPHEDRVLFFTSVGPNVQEIVYRIRATNKGDYTVPPVLAISMYNPAIKAMNVANKIAVQ